MNGKKPKCCRRVYGVAHGFSGSDCSKPAKVQRDGKWYCGVHDPEKVKARDEKARAERAARYDLERAISTAEREIESIRAEATGWWINESAANHARWEAASIALEKAKADLAKAHAR